MTTTAHTPRRVQRTREAGYPEPAVIPDGTPVHYHGRKTNQHGTYTAHQCDCHACTHHAHRCTDCQHGRLQACDDRGGGAIRYVLIDEDDESNNLMHAGRRSITPAPAASSGSPVGAREDGAQ